MFNLQTIYSSNSPIDCYILKGRLESEGLKCFVFDEYFVWVHPFKAVTIGGVKLKMPEDQIERGLNVIRALNDSKLLDESGEYDLAETFDNEFERQNEILEIKKQIRQKPSLIQNYNDIKKELISNEELLVMLKSETEFQVLLNKKFNFSWDEFICEFFDFNGDVISYLRYKPNDFYLEHDILNKYLNQKNSNIIICPRCKSDNVNKGYAIDNKWRILYLILSLIILFPFPPLRRKKHCFKCGFDF